MDGQESQTVSDLLAALCRAFDPAPRGTQHFACQIDYSDSFKCLWADGLRSKDVES
jgi:hypothetical protein